MLTLFLVDDHAMVRTGMRALLDSQPDMRVVGEAGSVEEALPRIRSRHPELVTLDLEMPGRGGGEAVVELLNAVAGLRVVVVSHRLEPEEVRWLCERGISGYVCKTSPASELVRVVRLAGSGQVAFCPESSAALVGLVRSPPRPNPLTARQMEVLTWLARGFTTREIAGKLCVSLKTVEKHRSGILRALDARNTVEALERARRLRLLSG